MKNDLIQKSIAHRNMKAIKKLADFEAKKCCQIENEEYSVAPQIPKVVIKVEKKLFWEIFFRGIKHLAP